MKARRWSDTAAFRADPAAAQIARPSRRQTIALLVVLALIAGAVVAASYLVRPEKARAFDLVHGSVFLEDTYAPVGIDLATGKPTVRLADAVKQVGAAKNNQLSVVPLQDATLLLNNGTDNANSGEFNEVDDTGFVTKPDGSGVPLSKRTDQPESLGFADTGPNQAPGSAYIERTGPGGTDVVLVTESTVRSASTSTSDVKPRASVTLDDAGLTRAGAAAGAQRRLLAAHRSRQPAGVASVVGAGRQQDRRQAHGQDPRFGRRLGRDRRGDLGRLGRDRRRRRRGTGPHHPLHPGRRDGHEDDRRRRRRADHPAGHQPGRSAGAFWNAPPTAGGSFPYGRTETAMPSTPRCPASRPTTTSPSRPAAATPCTPSTGPTARCTRSGSRTTSRASPPWRRTRKQTGEAAGLGDAYVVGRGPRVIVNSAGHGEALVVFTDGSRGPLVVRKSQAVTINAGATATTYTQDKVNQTNQRRQAEQRRHRATEITAHQHPGRLRDGQPEAAHPDHHGGHAGIAIGGAGLDAIRCSISRTVRRARTW